MDLSDRANHRDREVRTFDAELRAVGEGRTIEGLAAPFNSPTTIRDAFGEFTETILPGAFSKTIAERSGKIKLLAQHNRSAFPLGNIPRLSEDAQGLRMEAIVANTTAGNDALALVDERVVMGLSIGFHVMDQTWNADFTDRQISEIKLMEISLVAEPAYADAGVTGVRDINGLPFGELAHALEALRDGTASDGHLDVIRRARTALDELIPIVTDDSEDREVPQSIREELAALYAAQPYAA
jgi:HK97 family phage prohead protease